MSKAQREVTKITHNWFYTEDGESEYTYEVGEKNVKYIVEHPAQGEGDRYFFEVWFEDETMIAIFNPNLVWFKINNTGNPF